MYAHTLTAEFTCVVSVCELLSFNVFFYVQKSHRVSSSEIYSLDEFEWFRFKDIFGWLKA